jgi:hypothetical protein
VRKENEGRENERNVVRERERERERDGDVIIIQIFYTEIERDKDI